MEFKVKFYDFSQSYWMKNLFYFDEYEMESEF